MGAFGWFFAAEPGVTVAGLGEATFATASSNDTVAPEVAIRIGRGLDGITLALFITGRAARRPIAARIARLW
jgi:hypothetical protein